MSQRELLTFWLKGNTDAVKLCEDVFDVSQIIDDLYDRDKPVSGEDIHRMTMLVFSEIPRNPFYAANRDTLQSYLETALMGWIDSTNLESRGEAGRRLAFVYRDIIGGLANKCALLIGGYEWWATVSVDIHCRMTHDESYELFSRGIAR